MKKVKKMAGIKNRGSQVHKVKTKFKRNKKVDLPEAENADENFLDKILAHIPDYFGNFGVQLMEYGFSGGEVKDLLIKSFEKSGTDGLIKELESHNFFMVFVDDSLPSNYSLVSDKNWCVWFWKNFDIEEFTFFVIELPSEFKIYLHETSSSIRLYGKANALEIGAYKKGVDMEKIFKKIVEDYMLQVFCSELDLKLGCDGGSQEFIYAMDEGEFSKDFDTGGFFNFEGIDFPIEIKTMAYQKILQDFEEYTEEEDELI